MPFSAELPLATNHGKIILKLYLENKHHYMEYKHKRTHLHQETVIASARKMIMTIFWECKGAVHTEFINSSYTVTADHYVFPIQNVTILQKLHKISACSSGQTSNSSAHTHMS